MTLTIHTEEDEQRQLAVTIEVPEARVEDAMRRTARKLARDVNIPGFRRGKVPYNVMIRRFGKEAIRAEAIEDLIQPVFEEALEQIEAEPYAQATFDDMEMEPLVLKFTIPLQPEVNLGDYRALRKDIEPVTVTDEALEDALERVRTRHQVLEAVDRPAEAGDLVTVSGTGVLLESDEEEEAAATEESEAEETAVTEAETGETAVEEADEEDTAGKVIFNEEHIDLVMDGEETFPGTPFVDNIIGTAAGEQTTFSFTFPDDYEEETFAGKTAEFTIDVLNVQRREVPELNDELAQEEGDYETVDELRDALRQQLQEQAESEAQDELIEEMIDDLLKDAELMYPPAAVEQEIDNMLQSFKSQASRSGWQWEDFLTLQGTSEEEIREDFRDSAEERVERQLVLRQFVLEEKLTVETEDVDAYVENRIAAFDDNKELQQNMRDYYRSGYGFDMISSEILMGKAHERIQAILAGEAPDLDELDETDVSAAADTEEE